MVMFNLDGYVFLSKRKVCMACILRERKCGVQQPGLLVSVFYMRESMVFNNVLLPVFYVRESVVLNKVLMPVFYVIESVVFNNALLPVFYMRESMIFNNVERKFYVRESFTFLRFLRRETYLAIRRVDRALNKRRRLKHDLLIILIYTTTIVVLDMCRYV